MPTAHPTRAKWVLVPAHSIGLTLGDRLAREGCDWANLRFVTPLDIAVRMAAPFLVEQGINPSEEPLGPALAMRLQLDPPEAGVASEIPGFEIVEALRAPKGIDLRAIVRDGNRLYFLLLQPGQGAQLFGGAQLSGAKSPAGSRSASRVRPVFTAILPPGSGGFEGPESSRHVRLDINIRQIARDLKLEE